MNNEDSDRLLEDVLEEAAPTDFRASLLAVTLRQVRRRRRARTLNRTALPALAVMCSLLLWRSFTPGPPKIETRLSEGPSFGLVLSQPLDPDLVVESGVGSANTISSSVGTIAVVESGPAAGAFRELTDDELLLLCAGKPVALVRDGPHESRLVFLNAKDSQGFTVQ